jgi:hypothetical protein
MGFEVEVQVRLELNCLSRRRRDVFADIIKCASHISLNSKVILPPARNSVATRCHWWENLAHTPSIAVGRRNQHAI